MERHWYVELETDEGSKQTPATRNVEDDERHQDVRHMPCFRMSGCRSFLTWDT